MSSPHPGDPNARITVHPHGEASSPLTVAVFLAVRDVGDGRMEGGFDRLTGDRDAIADAIVARLRWA